MNRLFLIVMINSLAFLASAAQARTVTVTEADNGKIVTLGEADTLTVDLPVNTAAGYTWYVVYDPDGPLRLSGKQSLTVGVGISSADSPTPMSKSTWEYLCFKVAPGAKIVRRGYLNLLRMRNKAGVEGGVLWHLRYIIKADAGTTK